MSLTADLVGVLSLEYVRATPGQRVQAAMSAVPLRAPDPSTFPLASPWASNDLNRIVAEDVFGSDLPNNTRAAAMRIPAIARGRNLLVSTISRFPMIAKRRDTILAPEVAPWMTRTDSPTPPQLRLAWTVDDLIFYGWSCWARHNGSNGYPLAMTRVNQGDWTLNDDMQVEIHGNAQKPDDVVVIAGLHEGILSYGVDALRDAKALYATVRDRIENPIPQVELHQTGGTPLTKTERDDLIDVWRAARSGKSRGVGFTNEFIELKAHGGDDGNLMIEARNAASLDMARLIGVSATMLDATSNKASLNYETSQGRNQEFVDFDLALYMLPITARLSCDDVMPIGQHASFDLGDFVQTAPSVTGPALED